MFTYKIDCPQPKGRILWLHGWGLDHSSLLPIARYFSDYENILVDFPGFGKSPVPDAIYGVPEYAEEIRSILLANDDGLPLYIAGHSFGGRIGVELASVYPDMVDGLILIAAAGLKRKRSIYFKVKAKIIKYLAKMFPSLKLGSPDYLRAVGNMRKIFVKVINYDQEAVAKKIKCRTLLVYGENDTETPAMDIGLRFNRLITDSKYHMLRNIGHLTILTDGRHQVQNLIENFLQPNG